MIAELIMKSISVSSVTEGKASTTITQNDTCPYPVLMGNGGTLHLLMMSPECCSWSRSFIILFSSGSQHYYIVHVGVETTFPE